MNRSNTQKKILIICTVLLAVLFAFELFLVRVEHAEVWWQKLKGFYLLLGAAGGAGLMFLAKAIGNYFLYRSEDYYD